VHPSSSNHSSTALQLCLCRTDPCHSYSPEPTWLRSVCVQLLALPRTPATCELLTWRDAAAPAATACGWAGMLAAAGWCIRATHATPCTHARPRFETSKRGKHGVWAVRGGHMGDPPLQRAPCSVLRRRFRYICPLRVQPQCQQRHACHVSG
jgi:hypothetical protein